MWLSGCVISAQRCAVDSDCFEGEVCSANRCQPAPVETPDADRPDGATEDVGNDSGVDAAPDSGPEPISCLFRNELVRWDFRDGDLENDADGPDALTGSYELQPSGLPGFDDGLILAGAQSVSTQPRTDLIPAFQNAGGFTIEALVTPAAPTNTTETQHRIFSWGDSVCRRNVTLLWDSSTGKAGFRVRRSTTSLNGLPQVDGAVSILPGRTVHLIVTGDVTTGTVDLYLDGDLIASSGPGDLDLSSWNDEYPIVIGDEGKSFIDDPCTGDNDRPLEGIVALVAMHQGFKTDAQADSLFLCRSR